MKKLDSYLNPTKLRPQFNEINYKKNYNNYIHTIQTEE